MSLREDWPVPEVNEFVDAVFRAEDEREKKAFQNALHERKGRTPVAVSYNTVPKEKRSVRGSSSLPSACSGDMYATVPSVLPALVSCSSVTVGAELSLSGLPGLIFARPLTRHASPHGRGRNARSSRPSREV